MKYVLGILVFILLASCSINDESSKVNFTNKINGPYPARISATISDTYHVAYDPPEEMIWFSEYENSHFHIESLKFDKYGFKEGKKFTISVEPGDIELCGGNSPCFRIL